MDRLIAKAAETTKKVMAGVKSSQFGYPTPCSEFNVKQLANHMAGLLIGAESAAKKLPRVAPPDPAPDIIGNNPGPAYADLAAKTVAAWSKPGAFDGNTEFGPGEMPAQMAGAITLLEIAVHGWDMAAATGQSYKMDPTVAATVFETLKQIGSGPRDNGPFGPEVKVAKSDSVQDQLLAFSGRDPKWHA